MYLDKPKSPSFTHSGLATSTFRTAMSLPRKAESRTQNQLTSLQRPDYFSFSQAQHWIISVKRYLLSKTSLVGASQWPNSKIASLFDSYKTQQACTWVLCETTSDKLGLDKDTEALAGHPEPLETVDPPVHHVDSLEVDQRFADLQAEQHQRYVCQRALVLRQVGPQLQEHQHRTEVSHELAWSTASLPAVGCRLASYLPSEGAGRRSYKPLRTGRAPWRSTRDFPQWSRSVWQCADGRGSS